MLPASIYIATRTMLAKGGLLLKLLRPFERLRMTAPSSWILVFFLCVEDIFLCTVPFLLGTLPRPNPSTAGDGRIPRLAPESKNSAAAVNIDCDSTATNVSHSGFDVHGAI